MKKPFQIVIITSLLLLLLRFVSDQVNINFSENIDLFIWNLFVLVELFIVFIAIKKIYIIHNFELSYLKLVSFALIIVILKYVFCYIYGIIFSKYFPSLDPLIKFSEALHITYEPPQFKPFRDLILYPFTQPYGMIFRFKEYITAVFFILNQGLFYSLFLTFLVKKFYRKPRS